MTNEELVEKIQHEANIQKYLEQLYIQNKGFIATIIRRYRYICRSDYDSIPIVEMDELMHEAYFGLVKAARNFNPEQGASFLTYSAYWINLAVKRFLENSGQVIRIPVHMQEKIYKYNQTTSYFLSHYGRKPEKQEYASYIGIPLSGVDKLEKFMFHGTVHSLDESISNEENEGHFFADVVPDDIDIEKNTVDKLAAVHLREELWEIVAKVLEDENKLDIFRKRYIENLSFDQIGKQLQLNRSVIDQTIKYGLKLIRRNPRARDLGEELGIWYREHPIDAHRVKRLAIERKFQAMNKREWKYAVNMGWIDSDKEYRSNPIR